MASYILTSMSSDGFRGDVAEMFQQTIKKQNTFVIGMSASSINMAKTSLCTMSLGHYEQKIYEGLGCVDISVEPHFVKKNLSDELMELSKKYRIYGLCDESIIVCENGKTHFYGEIYEMQNGKIKLLQNLKE